MTQKVLIKRCNLSLYYVLRDRAEVARVAHNHKVGGSNPPPATVTPTKRKKVIVHHPLKL